jgi:hypothetical protein
MNRFLLSVTSSTEGMRTSGYKRYKLITYTEKGTVKLVVKAKSFSI